MPLANLMPEALLQKASWMSLLYICAHVMCVCLLGKQWKAEWPFRPQLGSLFGHHLRSLLSYFGAGASLSSKTQWHLLPLLTRPGQEEKSHGGRDGPCKTKAHGCHSGGCSSFDQSPGPGILIPDYWECCTIGWWSFTLWRYKYKTQLKKKRYNLFMC